MNGYGVAGYRIDAAKHMWPNDLEAIWISLDDLRANHFGPGRKPYFYLEVCSEHVAHPMLKRINQAKII